VIPRRFKRLNHSAPGQIRLSQGADQFLEFEGTVTDISVSGLSIVLADDWMGPIASGSRASISIARAGSTPLEVYGSVIRSVVGLDNSQQVAICYDRAHYDVVAAIASHERVVIELTPPAWTGYEALPEIED